MNIDIEAIENWVEETRHRWKVPAIGLALVINGKEELLRGFGQRDLDLALPATESTLFAIGSCTKAFTATALALLVERGLMQWNVPVKEYIPSFELYDRDASAKITPVDLLIHSSGLPRHDLVWYSAPQLSRKDLLSRLRYLEPSKDLRSAWQYQNLMYVVAGYLIQELTGMTWEDFVLTHILKPLGMSNTNFSVRASQLSTDYALPYVQENEAVRRTDFFDLDAMGPAGSINSCVRDMAKWLLFHLGYSTHEIFGSTSSLEKLHTPHMPISTPPRYEELSYQDYCLGWVSQTYRGRRLLYHGGNIDGFSALTSFCPELSIGLVVLSNMGQSPAPQAITFGIYDRLFGMSPLDWNARLESEQEQSRKMTTLGREFREKDRKPDAAHSHSLEDYTGTYSHPGYGTLQISQEEDGSLSVRLNELSGKGAHYHYDTFLLEFEKLPSPLPATFTANSRGIVDRVSIPLEASVSEVVFRRRAAEELYDRSYLQSFVGDYIAESKTVTVTLDRDALRLVIPGELDISMIPENLNTFVAINTSSIYAEFAVSEETTRLILAGPEWAIEAQRTTA